MDDVINNIPSGLGLYLEIGFGIVILLFLLFGLLKNWKFSLIQIVLFIVALISVKAICDNIYVSNPEIKSLVDQYAKEIAKGLEDANNEIGKINSQTGTNLPNLDGNVINSSYIGLAYSLIAAIASIGYALIALIISFILALVIYLIIRHFIKENPKYKNVCNKFWYKAIGMAPNLILGLMFVSLVLSPIYISKNIALNSIKYPGNVLAIVQNDFKDELNKVEEIKDKVSDYKSLIKNYQDQMDSIDYDIKKVDSKLTTADSEIKTVYEVFSGDYLNKANIINSNYKNKLSDIELKECEEFINGYFNTKSEFDKNYNSYTSMKNEFNNTLNEYNNAKSQMETYKSKLQEADTALNKFNLEYIRNEISKIEKYETTIENVLPNLKVLGFLVIDCGMYKVKVDGVEYSLQGSYNDLYNYIDNYISNAILVAKEKSIELLKNYDEQIAKVDAEIKKYQSEIEEKLNNFDSNKIIKEVDENLSKFNEYKDKTDDIKQNIDKWYNKVK